MSLLLEIQNDAIDASTDIAPTLLKLRLLAAKLDVRELEDWVRHESEGYPDGVSVPEYRKLAVAFYADFMGAFNSGIRNATIPPHVIRTEAGDGWLEYSVTNGISEIDDSMGRGADDNDTLQISNAQDLVFRLQGKMFPDYNIVEVRGIISKSGFAGIRHAVRSKILELTIQLEKEFPDAIQQLEDDPTARTLDIDKSEAKTMTTKIVHGNYTEVINSGSAGDITISIDQGDINALTGSLVDGGLPKPDADEIAALIAAEKPTSAEEPLGPNAQKWLVKNLGKALNGTWKIGATVATNLITQAAIGYYGLQ